MPAWWAQFFCCWTNLSLMVQSCVLLSLIQATKMSLVSLFALPMEPWLGCLGFPWTIMSWGHNSLSSLMTSPVNSGPLSLYKMACAPKRRKMSNGWKAKQRLKDDKLCEVALVNHSPLELAMWCRLHVNKIHLTMRVEFTGQNRLHNNSCSLGTFPLLLTHKAVRHE